ncbi:hypothetical protein CCAND95_50064 [Capnocytophaga canis]|uniref:Uncharacterized protein n=1 Tax=Capnocytophaga canis TaxID=1848903 RepID=A0A0B7IF99_9FLAO|nr:hypothetical protein CCAND95_50064 [Capnocytophaga canis]CEN49334.1 hypothetical protein CCAND38_80067 [Capnocytophaga canis]CEN51885.1 hypothetical protein CCAND93_20022 [Capnocytophaga canis]
MYIGCYLLYKQLTINKIYGNKGKLIGSYFQIPDLDNISKLELKNRTVNE